VKCFEVSNLFTNPNQPLEGCCTGKIPISFNVGIIWETYPMTGSAVVHTVPQLSGEGK